MTTQTKLVETFNFMSGLPDKIMTEQVLIKSGHSSGYTRDGFIAYYHNGIRKTSAPVWGLDKVAAIANLKAANGKGEA